MNFLNSLIRIIIFVIWALIVYYLSKQLGFEYDPESPDFLRKYIRVILIAIIFGGAYFIWKIDISKKK
jgi:membrane protein DedA with SNARE-associated domain